MAIILIFVMAIIKADLIILIFVIAIIKAVLILIIITNSKSLHQQGYFIIKDQFKFLQAMNQRKLHQYYVFIKNHLLILTTKNQK